MAKSNGSCAVQIGGISTKELNQLELELLVILDFRAFIKPKELSEVLGLFAGSLDFHKPAEGSKEAKLDRHGVKRGIEGPQPESESLQPAKLQHDKNSDQVLVTPEARSGKGKSAQEGSSRLGPVVALQCQADERAKASAEAPAVQIRLAICAGSN